VFGTEQQKKCGELKNRSKSLMPQITIILDANKKANRRIRITFEYYWSSADTNRIASSANCQYYRELNLKYPSLKWETLTYSSDEDDYLIINFHNVYPK